jgi:hypothetical protein
MEEAIMTRLSKPFVALRSLAIFLSIALTGCGSGAGTGTTISTTSAAPTPTAQPTASATPLPQAPIAAHLTYAYVSNNDVWLSIDGAPARQITHLSLTGTYIWNLVVSPDHTIILAVGEATGILQRMHGSSLCRRMSSLRLLWAIFRSSIVPLD